MKYSFSKVFEPKIISSFKNYNREQFQADMLSGVIVGIVAIPLAIAFGIASGVGPTEGLVTAIIAGFIISLFGGSKVQIGGPTGAFIIIVYGIIQQHGVGGLMIATIMAGILLILMGALKLGNVIKFVPYPVIVGFTAGIALTIFSTQMNDLFGMQIANVPANFINKWICYFQNFSSVNWWALLVGVVTLSIIIITPRFSKKIPGSLVAIILVTILVWALNYFAGINSIQTIGDLYELPTGIPKPKLPSFNLSEGETFIDLIVKLFPSAFTIALLGAIESLLSAMVADGVIGDKHNSNTELIAQGIANFITPIFGGIPATGAIARTMTNINNGGRTPMAGIIHAIVLLLVLLLFGSLVGYIPMACLAGVLLVVAYNMSGWRTISDMWKSRSEFLVMLVTLVLTVIFDLTVAIEVGLIISIALFMKRTNESTKIRTFQNNEIDLGKELDLGTMEEKLTFSKGIEVYEIDGPYFFGIANKFDEIMKNIGDNPQVRVIRMRKVPFIDLTGINNLEFLCKQSHKENIHVILSGVNDDVRYELKQANFEDLIGKDNICPNIQVALGRAEAYLNKSMDENTDI